MYMLSIVDCRTRLRTLLPLTGGPKQITPETVKQYVEVALATDLPKQEETRQRTRDLVKEQATAEKLVAWYPSFCKRLTISDDYLQTFNKSHVHLIDTSSTPIEKITRNGIVVAGHEQPVDMIIWSTGFSSPMEGSAAERSKMTITGVDGQDMATQFHSATGLTTLHGVCSRGFPNLFWASFLQGTISANYISVVMAMSGHFVDIVTAAENKVGVGKRAVIKPTGAAEQDWAGQIQEHSLFGAPRAGCTPGYLNGEGIMDEIMKDPEQAAKFSRLAPWGKGINDYTRVVNQWVADGMEGLEVVEASQEARNV